MDFSFGDFCFTFSFLVLVVFVGGWVSAYFFRKQFLLSLLSLEFIILSLFLGFVSFLSFVGGSVTFTVYLLVLGACEAVLGLCLLVSFVRLLGNDMLSNVSLVIC